VEWNISFEQLFCVVQLSCVAHNFGNRAKMAQVLTAAQIAAQELTDCTTALGLLGLSAEAVADITTGQGVSSLRELAALKDPEVVNLCKVVRKPGGMLAGPLLPKTAVGDPDVYGPPTANHGIPISLIAENNLKLLTYYAMYKQRTYYAIDVTQLRLSDLRNYETLKRSEIAHKDPVAPEINDKDWPRTIEGMQEYFGSCLGATKNPLAYLIRKELAPNTAPTGGWSSQTAELIGRIPIVKNLALTPYSYHNDYLADNAALWLKLAAMTRDKPCWTYIRQFQKTHDAHKAFWALYNHYLGPSNLTIWLRARRVNCRQRLTTASRSVGTLNALLRCMWTNTRSYKV
jgi:hypothetical protein